MIAEFLQSYGLSILILLVLSGVIVKMIIEERRWRNQDQLAHKEKSQMFQEMVLKRDQELDTLAKIVIRTNKNLVKVLASLKKK